MVGREPCLAATGMGTSSRNGVCLRTETLGAAGKQPAKAEGGELGIIGWILLGLGAGALARLVLPGADPAGIILTILIGIAGALVGGTIARVLGLGNPIHDFFSAATWVAAIAGSALLLLLQRFVAASLADGTRE